METHPSTREEAKRTGAKYYFTGKPCTRGHVALRKTKGACVECMKEDWKKELPQRLEYKRVYNASEAGQKSKRKYYEKNREWVIAQASSRPKEVLQQYRKNWKIRNSDIVAADVKHRRNKHYDATPPWLTPEQKRLIRSFYVTARRLTRETKVPYVVDHIIPLRHPLVCGLHVPWNLQVLPRVDNLLKSNKHDVITEDAKAPV
jgi:hypothetical protein